MGINLCRAQVLVAEELLNDPNIAGSHEVCSEGVPQNVWMDFAADRL